MSTMPIRGTAMRRGAVVLASVMAMVAAAVWPADATMVHREQIADTFGYTYDDCGFPVEVVAEVAVDVQIHDRREDDGAYWVHSRLRVEEIHTNPENDEWLVIHGRRNLVEVKGEQVDGDVWRFDAVEAGQPFVLEDSDGNVVLRDRGVLRHSVLLDTHGDDQPGGTLIEVLGTTVHGPHPAWESGWCDAVDDLLG